jgi:hypothetical protein
MKKFLYFIVFGFQFICVSLFSEVPFLFVQKTVVTPANFNESEKALISHVQNSIQHGDSHFSSLKNNVLSIEGMSSPKVRHFLNNLCALSNATYLEIGTWKGSTFISALKNNNGFLKDAIAIDNWSLFEGPKTDFFNNCRKYLPQYKYRFFSQDSFSINLDEAFSDLVDIYFYDGDHNPQSQEMAFTYYNDVFNDLFIAVIDDWNWEYVREGTFNAFNKLGYIILFQQYLPARFTGDNEQWWNGLYVAVIKKK